MILKTYTLLLQFLLLPSLIFVCNPNAILLLSTISVFSFTFLYSPQDKFLNAQSHLGRKWTKIWVKEMRTLGSWSWCTLGHCANMSSQAGYDLFIYNMYYCNSPGDCLSLFCLLTQYLEWRGTLPESSRNTCGLGGAPFSPVLLFHYKAFRLNLS